MAPKEPLPLNQNLQKGLAALVPDDLPADAPPVLTRKQQYRLRFWDVVIQNWEWRFQVARIKMELIVEPGKEHLR